MFFFKYPLQIKELINILQDGFFDGELLDGRRGLVPSNYVEQLYGRDLEDFYQSMVVRLRECDDSATTTVPQNIEYMLPGKYK
jgi:RIMS-binding protein 2